MWPGIELVLRTGLDLRLDMADQTLASDAWQSARLEYKQQFGVDLQWILLTRFEPTWPGKTLKAAA